MSTPALELRAVEKRFFGHAALRGVDLRIEPGKIVGLVGENGAGKSTLLNIVAGILAPDAGEFRLAGKIFAPTSPSEAIAAGIALVHQELNLFTNLSVAENLFLSDLPMRGIGPLRWIDRTALRSRATGALRAVGLNVDPHTPVSALSPGERQLVEIAKALIARPKILLLDEPTTSLTNREVRRLFELIEKLKSDGLVVLYVSHNLDDVRRLADAIVVLRDGEVRASGPADSFDSARLIPLMVGRAIDTLFPPRTAAPGREVLLDVRGLFRAGVAENISLSLHRGEVLGIAGLMGAGRTELARMLFGLDNYDCGIVEIGGKPLRKHAPRDAVMRGIAFVSENRRDEGLLRDDYVPANIALASLDRYARGPLRLLPPHTIAEDSSRLAQELDIDCRPHQRASTLSGGNQQKVVLARWLLTNARVFILDEPTRGVDVGARRAVYEQINKLAERGAGVLLISSEIEELIDMCDRILVMSRGKIQANVPREEFDRERLLKAAFAEVA